MMRDQRADVWDLWCAHKNTAEIGRLMNKPEHEVYEVVRDFLTQLWEARHCNAD